MGQPFPPSGNVFADLGLRDADELVAKADLAHAIQQLIQARGLSQRAAACRLGVAQPDLSNLYRGRLEDRSFSAFFLQGGRLLSAFSLNRPRDVRRSMRLIRAGVRPDPAALRDENVDLRTLFPSTKPPRMGA